MKWYFLIAILLIFPACVLSDKHCSFDDPVDMAENIYNNHFTFYWEPREHIDILAPEFRDTLLLEDRCAQGRLCAMSAVPWLDAQDGDAGSVISTELESRSTTGAIVVLKFEFVLGPKVDVLTVKIHLEKGGEKGCWLFSDLVTPSGDSLRSYIHEWHEKYSPAPAHAGAGT